MGRGKPAKPTRPSRRSEPQGRNLAAPCRSFPWPARVGLIALAVIGPVLGYWLLARWEILGQGSIWFSEDGWLESAGALACLAASLAAFLAGIRAWPARRGQAPDSDRLGHPLLWWTMAAALALMFLEEMSWMQRIIGFASPGWARGQNVVGEFNLHNLRAFYGSPSDGPARNWLQFAWMMLTTAYLCGGGMTRGRWPRASALARRWGLPWPGPISAAAQAGNLAGFLLLAISAGRQLDQAVAQELSELFEALTELLVAAVVCRAVVTAGLRWSAAPGALTVATLEGELRALLDQGNQRLANQDWNGALECYESMLTKSPGNALALYSAGLVHHQAGRLDLAETHFGDAIAAQPRFVPAWINLGIVHMQRQQTKKAIDHFQTACELHPASVEAHFNLGVAHLAAENRTAAAQAFQRVLQLDLAHQGARENLRLLEIDQATEPATGRG